MQGGGGGGGLGPSSAGTSSTGPERPLKSGGLKQARKSLDRAAVLDDSDEEVPGSGPSGHQPQPAQLDDAAIQVKDFLALLFLTYLIVHF